VVSFRRLTLPRILLADDHAVVRRGIRSLLTEEFPAAAFGEAGTGAEAIELAERQAWDLALIDVGMPQRGGMDALAEIHARHPQLPLLVLSQHDEDQYAVRALRAGAVGYVTKQMAPEELVAATHRALAGRRYVSPALAEKLAERVSTDWGPPLHESLSNRELQILKLLAAGKRGKQIASELCLSEKTVSTYRSHILEKLGMETSADLIRYALKSGLCE
jgi:two-component system, NarL family, invasion response regulator UvrY